MSKREQARVLAVQALYQWDLRSDDFADHVSDFLAESTQDSEVYFFARELTLGAWNARENADRIIHEAAVHWEVSRMAAVDRNILRLAIFELSERFDIPARVTLDQAIELAKRFGTAESGGFVNGILDNVLRRLRPDEAAALESDEKQPTPTDDAAAEAHRPDQAYPDIRNWDEE